MVSMFPGNQFQYLVFSWISVLLSIIGTIIIFNEYRRFKARPLVYLEFILFFLIPFSVCHGLLFIVGFENPELMIFLFRIQIFFLFVVVCFLVLFLESLRVDKPASLISMILGIGVGSGIIICILPESIEFNTFVGPYLSDFARIVFGIDLIVLLLVISLQVYRFLPYTPKSFSKPAFLFYCVYISPILLPFILILTKLSWLSVGLKF